ncbi:nuclear transport factor 2 family protein [Actinomadura atramentaria]|uniref:nuclear transport factor 2 family protein n=1 Tax=Actinomadura atramentaria TaxID=1990 RepID=UPI0003628BFD|nr:nuclear transport factor 2 family protein [Actinomadura atramentaria]
MTRTQEKKTSDPEADEKPAAETAAEEPEREPEAVADVDEADAETEAEPEKEAATDEAAERAGSEKEKPAVKKEAEPRRGRDPLVLVALTVTVIAAVAAAWFGWSYYSASHDDTIAYARTRDEVLRAADQGIINLNTLDYRSVDAGLKVWQDSTTADLYDQIVQGRDEMRASIQKGKTNSSAKILESALTELDSHAGKAAVMAAVRVTVTADGGRSSTRTSRMLGQLTKTPTGWKLSALQQAPTGVGE